jgi:hypothetical protein
MPSATFPFHTRRKKNGLINEIAVTTEAYYESMKRKLIAVGGSVVYYETMKRKLI